MEKINNIYCIQGFMADSNSYLIDNSNLDGDYNYILVDTGTGENGEYLYSAIKELGISIEDIDLIINTHCHFDHVGGNYLFPDVKIAIGENDASALMNDGDMTVSKMFGSKIKRHDVDVKLKEGDKIANFEVISTPGHTSGGISLYDGEVLICGDTIFANGGIGRMDIGGNVQDMKESLIKLKKLDVKYLLPGHGPWVNNGNDHISMSVSMLL